MNLIKINYMNKMIKNIMMRNFVFFVQSIALGLILVASSCGMEVEPNESPPGFESMSLQTFEELPDDLLPVIFNLLDQGRLPPYQLFSAAAINVCNIPINDFIAAGGVCHKWRRINLSMRGNRILSIPESKKLISAADYEAIQNSGYQTLSLFSRCATPEDISYLDRLDMIKSIAFLPPKGTRAYIYPLFTKTLPEEKYLNLDVIKNIHRLKNLKTLILNGNNLDADDLQSILHLCNLSMLDLSYNNLGDEFLLSLTSLKNLKFLKILKIRIHDLKALRLAFSQGIPGCSIESFC
jgi:hypothetical protein